MIIAACYTEKQVAMELTLEKLPKAVSDLITEVKDIKNLLAQYKQGIPDSKKLLNIQEASKILNLAIPTIYGLVSKKEIPFMKAAGGRKLYFLEEELTEWIKSGRQKTNAEIAEEAINSIGSKRRKG